MKVLILEYLSQCKTATTAEVADMLKTTDYQARYLLQCLTTEGKVKRSGIRRGAKTLWEIAQPPGMHNTPGESCPGFRCQELTPDEITSYRLPAQAAGYVQTSHQEEP
ncbi:MULTISPECIES: FaeA/PapI family transcriptional regulator [unclassified Escherichia]|uniref:FaeA/PapI family transcriptional regulator n=1 Tax=unclassified Escherichia TaxID=2608889 RepID=UPI000CF60F83|nr:MULTISPECIES: FaeA/PapI family transcriptional regulator [unclassified Escherichia]